VVAPLDLAHLLGQLQAFGGALHQLSIDLADAFADVVEAWVGHRNSLAARWMDAAHGRAAHERG